MRKLVVGNWKMNGKSSDLNEIGRIVALAQDYQGADCGLCLPATLLDRATTAFPEFAFGGQDCHMAPHGAHTGCISAEMLVDSGAKMTIIGHSERRADQNESDDDVHKKALAARSAGLSAIICVGESEVQRDAGDARAVILGQLEKSLPGVADCDWLSVAYEPIWAIGTGKVPSSGDIAEIHAAIRGALVLRFGDPGHRIHILYGGSMNGENADAILAIANVDGGLVGGASLNAEKFEGILKAAA